MREHFSLLFFGILCTYYHHNLKEQKRTIEEERKSLHHAMEEEHRRIISAKMKLAVHKRLHPEVVDFDNGYNNNNGEDTTKDHSKTLLDTSQNLLHLRNPKSVQVHFLLLL